MACLAGVASIAPDQVASRSASARAAAARLPSDFVAFRRSGVAERAGKLAKRSSRTGEAIVAARGILDGVSS